MPVLPGAPVGVPRATNRSPTFGWDKYDDLFFLLHILFSRVRPSRPPIVWACWLGLQVHPTHQERVSSEFRTLEPPWHTHTWNMLEPEVVWNWCSSFHPHAENLINIALLKWWSFHGKFPPFAGTLEYIPYFVGNCRIYIIPYDIFQDPMKLQCFFFKSFFGWFRWVKAVNSFNPWFSAKLELWGSSPVGSEDGSAAREV